MQLFKHRPLAALCTVFLFGIFVTAITDGAATPYVVALSALSLPLALLLRRLHRPTAGWRGALFLCVCASVLLLSQLFSYFAYIHPRRTLPASDETVTVVAHVEEVTFSREYACTFVASLETVNGEKATGRLAVECDFGAELRRGDRVSFHAFLFPAAEKEEIFLHADGILASAVGVNNLSVLSFSPTLSDRIQDSLDGWRTTLSSHLTSHVRGESGRLMSAMLLGDRDGLSGETTRDFRRLGLSHILSISGLHLHILIFLFSSFLSHLGTKPKPRLVLLCIAVTLYMMLTGFSPSIIRAGVMSILLSLSVLVREQADSLTSLSLVAFLMCLFSPSSLFDAGFLLSCFATFGILVMSELRQRRARPSSLARRFLGAVVGALLITLSAMTATLPITALFFGEFAWLSPLANLLLSPLFSAYLALAPFAMLFAPIPPIGAFLSLLGEWLLYLLGALSRLPHLLLDIAFGDLLVILFVGGVLFFLLLCFAKKKRTLALAGACILTLFVFSLTLHTVVLSTRTEVYYTELEKDEHLLFVDGAGALLYDASDGTGAARTESLALLDAAHVTELDGYFLSHYHVRHIHTIEKMLSYVSIRTLYLPTPTSEAEGQIYRSCVAIAEAHGLSVYRYEPYEEVPFRSLVLIPHKSGKLSGGGHNAIGLSVKYGQRMLTYLGAAMAESNCASTAASAVERSDFLIFGTHGSTERAYISYPRYPSSLCLVAVDEAAKRLHPTLYTLLLERGVLVDTDTVLSFSLSQ